MKAKFLDVGRIEPRPDWGMDAHSHTFHQLIVVLDGILHVQMGGREFHARAGELMWYPAGLAHQEQSDRKHPCETLFMGFAWETAPADWPLTLADTQGRITQLMQWLMAEKDSHYAGRESLREAFLQTILAEYHRLATHREDPLVTRIRAHIRQHLTEPIDLDGLARLAGLSKFHLIRRYRALTGRTPMEDVRRLRLQAARDLLLTTNLPLKEIAPRTGLGDAYHLSKLFRQRFRATPGSLRR